MNKTLVLAMALVLCPACGGEGVPATVGEFCGELGDAFCERIMQCGATGTHADCHNAFNKSCCLDQGTCAKPVRESITEDEYDACLSAFGTLSCADLFNGHMPSSCLTM